METVNVGHTVACSIVYLDQNGQPMLVQPVPDAPPTWTDLLSSPPVDTLTTSADGMTCSVAATAVGTDTVSVALAVGGVKFSASLQLAITAAPQVLTSIAVNGVVS